MPILNIIAIDQGANGGIATNEGGGISAILMPSGMTAICDTLHDIKLPDQIAYIERVGNYVAGNAGPSAAKFARHCGHIEAALYMLGIPTIEVTPKTWMKAVGPFPKDKSARKKAIKEAMARRYPNLKVTLKTADALGILTYAMEL